MIIAGIDPGLAGAIAFFNTETRDLIVRDMPTLAIARGKQRREIDPHALAALFWRAHCGHAFVETAWPRPRDGAVAGFRGGDGYGVIRGVLAAVGVPYTMVAPQRWKRALDVAADKDAARARASQLLPAAADKWPRKKDHGRAESALLCLYGVRVLNAVANDGV